jgi:hypothetical protein
MENFKITDYIRSEIEEKIKMLLEVKHLYQSTMINVDPINKFIDEAEKSSEYLFDMSRLKDMQSLSHHAGRVNPQSKPEKYKKKFRDEANSILNEFWVFLSEYTPDPQVMGFSNSINPCEFVLSSIQIPCANCDAFQPVHHAGYRGQTQRFEPVSMKITGIPHQTFIFPYQCQACMGEPIIFMVHRKGLKLTLTGRSYFEKIHVSATIPKEESKFFQDAIAAYNTGNVLAGLFLLRTTIEQYMRRILSITDRKSGEDLSDEYSKLLPDDFPKDRCPSLKTIYEELSVPIHEAKKDEKQFEKSKGDIEKHFDLLRLVPLEYE